ncbi:MAG: hypothetical protein ACI4W6_02950 [Acutalibacteraceae bacterium]
MKKEAESRKLLLLNGEYMESFMEWFRQYWVYVIVLVAVCIGAAFVFRAAIKAYKRYYARYRKEEAEIKHLVALKEKYGELTAETIENADEEELLEGVALSFQLKLQKFDDMSAEFAKLCDEKKYVYALDVFVSDKSVETFFKENGRELTEIIVPALRAIGLEQAADQAEKIRIMFDETDETTSINKAQIEKAEEYFRNNDILTKIKHKAAEYIKENARKLI